MITKMPNLLFSPDRSGNPFYFSFKNKKIETDSGTMPAKMPHLSAPNE
jgi:hypothetical protein